jgi:hypothetical protein
MNYENVIDVFKNDNFINSSNDYKTQDPDYKNLVNFLNNLKTNQNYIIKKNNKSVLTNSKSDKYLTLTLNKLNKNNYKELYIEIVNKSDTFCNYNKDKYINKAVEIIVEKCKLNDMFLDYYNYIIINFLDNDLVKKEFIFNLISKQINDLIEKLKKDVDISNYDILCDYYKLDKSLSNLYSLYYKHDKTIIKVVFDNIILYKSNNNILYILINILNKLTLKNNKDLYIEKNIKKIKELLNFIKDKKIKFKLMDIIDIYS